MERGERGGERSGEGRGEVERRGRMGKGEEFEKGEEGRGRKIGCQKKSKRGAERRELREIGYKDERKKNK